MKIVKSKGSYEPLIDYQKSNNLEDWLVCLDCGVLVASKKAHNRLHSIMSSWAWALAIFKTHHASAEVHDRYSIIERIESKRFGRDETESGPGRYEIAWRIWCWQQGYGKAEDRAIMDNWMRNDDERLTEKDMKDRDDCLSIADEVISLAKST
jgi:hypothetical protein